METDGKCLKNTQIRSLIIANYVSLVGVYCDYFHVMAESVVAFEGLDELMPDGCGFTRLHIE